MRAAVLGGAASCRVDDVPMPQVGLRAALERGLAVFCQKPLARSAAEPAAVICATVRADCLLGMDMCYRETRAGRALKDRGGQPLGARVG